MDVMKKATGAFFLIAISFILSFLIFSQLIPRDVYPAISSAIFGEESFQLGEELGGERLVVGENERGAVPARDEVGHRERLAAAGDALEDEPVLAGLQALDECVDGLRLVAGGLEVRN